MELQYLFPTAIATHSIPVSVQELEQAESCVPSQLDQGLNSSLLAGTNQLLESAPQLKQHIQQCVDEFCIRLGLMPCVIRHSWINCYQPYQNIRPHRHEFTVLSGAYYLTCQGDPGTLSIDNPLGQFRINELAERATEYTESRWDIAVHQQLLVLFPSWLTHYSFDNCASKRTVIGFDCVYKDQTLF
jgi:uncharacterized protein (TIGR02466 family)